MHVIVVLKVLEIKSSVLFDVPFNSSKTNCRISTTSCQDLKWKGALQIDEILRLSAYRKFEGSNDLVYFSLITISSPIDFSNGNSCGDSAEKVLQSKGITLSACRVVLAQLACVPFVNAAGKWFWGN